MRYLIIFIFFTVFAGAQVVNKTDSNRLSEKDTLVVVTGRKDSLKIFKPTIQDYLIQHEFGSKKPFDTIFTIQKSYDFSQYNNRDNFGRIQFANIGSGFQSLAFEVSPERNLAVLPTGKSYNIVGIKDIRYYDVKTPTTAFVYHNAVRNGAELYTTYTQNVGKNFNFAIDYVGLRSQGYYRNSLAASNNTTFSAHFTSKDAHYEAFAHYTHQNINNQENGGITEAALNENFLTGDSRFKNRQNLETNLGYSNSRLAYRRYYLTQQYAPFNSDKFPFKIRHTVFWQADKYYYGMSSAEAFYGSDLLSNYPFNTKKYSKNFSNTLSLLFDKERFKLSAGARYQIITLGVGDALSTTSISVPASQRESRIGAVGDLQIRLFNKVALSSNIEVSKGGKFGTYLRSENLLNFEPVKGYVVDAKVNFQSAYPSFNHIINASPYRSLNYYVENPKNETLTEIGGVLRVPFFNTSVFANYFMVNNYAYFNSDGRPLQSTAALNVSQIGGEATLKYNHFNFNTRLMFQSAISNKQLYPMPNFIGRVNVFYQNKAFKNAAEIQSGVRVYYFSKFASRDYLPVLNEFVLPGSSAYSIGGQPIADAYFNMKVKRMFFFVEAQHFNTTFMKNKSYTAPYFPVSDFRLNLGIIWYIFS